MLITLAIVLAVVIAAVLALAATKPDVIRVQRSTIIKAPRETVYPLVSDWDAFLTWSPFEKDPAVKRTFKGTPGAKGASYEWDGNNKIGAGRIEIIEAAAPSRLVMQLVMVRPMKVNNTVEFTFTPQGSPQGTATEVTWGMKGSVPFMAKLMGLFMNCEKMCGTQFEEGLAKLKSVAEAQTQRAAAA